MKKLLTKAAIVALFASSLAACGQTTDASQGLKEAYESYKTNATQKGETPLSYEEWLEAIRNGGLKGDKGDKGDKGEKGDKGGKGDTGEKDLDLNLALNKLKDLFGIETLVLTGGATINGAFLKAHLLDELSLVVAPYIEGNHEEKGYAELGEFINDSFTFVSAKPLEDGGVHLLFKRK